ncbi:MAG: c-type cytochrome [Kofleriaceae bacterium]|nr:c-type cytochrome [Kofleriaceae bacterium]
MTRLQAAAAAAALAIGACSGDDAASYEPGEELAGGETTVFETGGMAFSLAARNLKGARRDDFFVGNAFFKRNWVTAPASTSGQDGLGPTFNATACAACHFMDGRGAPPQKPDDAFLGLLVRLSVPGQDEHGGPLDEPNYGGQFNHHAVLGVPAEGGTHVTYVEAPGQFDDGTQYSLRVPTYTFSDLAYGAMAADVMTSPRTANAMIGLGLLEAVSEDSLLAHADEADADGDGISGRPNRVWDPMANDTRLGRFGWKANQPGVEQQVSGAFLGDIGITSPLHPQQNCPAVQTECSAAITGGDPEADQETIDQVTYYSRLLAVPARRDFKAADVLRGKKLFNEAGCASCHVAKYVTGEVAGLPELSHQTIFPYSDMLLHDMGNELADHRPDYLADGNEWRTPPLWGLGLVRVVNGHTNYLHDGRARDTSEAILWHGGEGAAARDAYKAMSKDERAALIRFVESL